MHVLFTISRNSTIKRDKKPASIRCRQIAYPMVVISDYNIVIFPQAFNLCNQLNPDRVKPDDLHRF